MTPDGARAVIRAGASVIIERGAGKISGYSDRDYAKAGAILGSASDVWRRAGLIVKVKEPVGPERQRMRPGQVLFCYLHLAPDPELVKALLRRKVFGIDYEHVELDDGRTPLLHPMSDVAGHLCITLGSYYLACHPKGRGILLGGLSGEHAGEVVVVGAGTVGRAAARQATAIQANVTILDISEKALRAVRKELGSNVRTIRSTPAVLAKAVAQADLLIGAVYSRGERAPKIITGKMIRSMRPGTMVMDVSIDQGGCVATSRVTTHNDPVFVRHGVIHYGVANMPGTVPKTSTRALTGATLPYVVKMARYGVEGALARYPELVRAINTRNGKLIHEGVRRSLPEIAKGH